MHWDPLYTWMALGVLVKKENTYADAVWHKIALVEDEDQVFVGGLCPQVLFDTPAPCAERVSCI